MRLVVVSGLSDDKLHSKLAPLLALDTVEEVALIRRQPLNLPGIRNYSPPLWMRRILPLAEAYRFLTVWRLCLHSPRPDRLIGIYLIPHGLYVGIIGWLLRVKTIQLLISAQELNLAFANRFLFGMIRYAHRVGVRGENSVRQLVAQGIPAGYIFVPPNVFDVESYTPDASTEPVFDLIYVGYLAGDKQLEMLLYTVAHLHRRHPQLRLALVGNGKQRPKLEALADKLRIESNLTFVGAVKAEDVPYYLNRARIFVMTSKSEGLPMALIEALSCGRPVVISKVGDVTTVARHSENAWIVSPSTAENFAEALDLLLKDDQLRAKLSEGALRTRERFKTEYSLTAAKAVWQDVLGLTKE